MGWMKWESWLIPGRIRYVSVHPVHTSSLAQKFSYPIGNRASLGTKQLASEPDLSPPSCAEVKKCVAMYAFPDMYSWHSA